MSALIWPRLGLMRPSCNMPLSRLGRVSCGPLHGSCVAAGEHVTYVVAPVGGIRFRSYALEEIRWTPCVHIVPTLRVVSRRISRSICRLDCNTYGNRKLGSTSEMLGAVNRDGSKTRFGKMGSC